MARSGPVWMLSAAALAVAVAACTYKFDDIPQAAQIACADGGAPCPVNWECDESVNRCRLIGSVPEVPEILVSPGGAITTKEPVQGDPGGSASLAVTLGATPTAPVRLLVVSTRTSEAQVYPPEMTFDSTNWNKPKIIDVHGVTDSLVDGDQPYEVVLGPPVTNDARYAALPEIRIPGTNRDSDDAGIIAVPTIFHTSESDSVSTPTPVGVYLSSKPSGLVTVPVTSLDETEGTVFPPELVFDAGNWNAPQTFRATGVDDYNNPIIDRDHPYTVRLGPATSTDPHFQGATLDVTGLNADNDSPGIYVSSTSVTVNESSPNSFGVVLLTQPAADVTIHFTSLTPSQVNVDPATATLTFDAGNWGTSQSVILNAVDDPYDDLVTYEPWTVQSSNSVSADPDYNGLDVDDVTGFTYDDESPDVLFNGFNSSMDEHGGPQTVTVTLGCRPHGQVIINLASADSSRLQVSPSSITLDGNTWSTGATMTITPVDNQVRESDPTVDVTFSVTAALPEDFGYQGLNIWPLGVTIQDDERVIFTLPTAKNGDWRDSDGALTFDENCRAEAGQNGQPLSSYYVGALVAANYMGPYYFWRSASDAPGDTQYDWVLVSGRNYLSETRTGPVIGRANTRNLFNFPLTNALSGLGDYWTGLNADWTSSADNCDQWTNPTVTGMGRAGASGATTSGAISQTSTPCNAPHRILCVERY